MHQTSKRNQHKNLCHLLMIAFPWAHRIHLCRLFLFQSQGSACNLQDACFVDRSAFKPHSKEHCRHRTHDAVLQVLRTSMGRMRCRRSNGSRGCCRSHAQSECASFQHSAHPNSSDGSDATCRNEDSELPDTAKLRIWTLRFWVFRAQDCLPRDRCSVGTRHAFFLSFSVHLSSVLGRTEPLS